MVRADGEVGGTQKDELRKLDEMLEESKGKHEFDDLYE